MSLLDGPLGAVFGTAFTTFFRDAVLHKAAEADGPAPGRFGVTTTDYPVKASLDALGARARAAAGLPVTAVRGLVLRAGLPVAVEIDDGLTVGGTSYRIVAVDADPAGAAVTVSMVPA